jgi:hypothetical protein
MKHFRNPCGCSDRDCVCDVYLEEVVICDSCEQDDTEDPGSFIRVSKGDLCPDCAHTWLHTCQYCGEESDDEHVLVGVSHRVRKVGDATITFELWCPGHVHGFSSEELEDIREETEPYMDQFEALKKEINRA